MDHMSVLKRAWRILWNYRALWIFGVILALTTFSWQSTAWTRQDGSRSEDGKGIQIIVNDDFSIRLPGEGLIIDLIGAEGPSVKIQSGQAWKEVANLRDLVGEVAPADLVSALITVLIAASAILGLLYILGKIAYYVAETAIIRMVAGYDAAGEALTIRQGFRTGWSRSAWRLFLIDLVVVLPVVCAIILLFILILSPLLLWATRDTAVGVFGTLVSAGLFFPFLAIVFVVAGLIALLLRFFHRACVLENLGVRESITHGLSVVRRHWRDVGVMWLIMIGLGFAWTLALIPLGLILIPLLLVLIIAGMIVGAVPAVLTAAIANLFVQDVLAWVLGVLVGLPFFILTVASPLIFLSGLWHTYKSSTWTLAYRELRGLEVLQTESWPDLAPSAA